MTPTHKPAESFEERLLHELELIVAERPAPAPGPSRRNVLTRPRLAIAGVGLAVAATAAVAVSGGDGAAPAYAVQSDGDGTVTVEIHSLRDAAGLERKLREAGVPAEVDYVPSGKMCREPRFRPSTGPHTAQSELRDDGSSSFTLQRDQLRPQDTVVITSTLGDVTSVGLAIASGPVAPCELVTDTRPAPGAAPPDGPVGSGMGGSGATRIPER